MPRQKTYTAPEFVTTQRLHIEQLSKMDRSNSVLAASLEYHAETVDVLDNVLRELAVMRRHFEKIMDAYGPLYEVEVVTTMAHIDTILGKVA